MAHVQAFNEGIKTHNFCAMIALFADDGVMAFENIPVGPFVGREAIAKAYSENPPTDEIVVLRTQDLSDHFLAEFAWSSTPAERGGDLEIYSSTGSIVRLTVVYGGSPDSW